MDDMNPAESHPLSGVLSFWEGVVDDAEATAAEYEEAGWDVSTLHPGDVTPLPAMIDDPAEAEEFGLDVLVPGDEFRALESLVDEATFDAYEAYRAQRGGVVFLVIVMQAESAGRAVVFPVYYSRSEAQSMCDLAREAGEMHTFVRPLSDDRRVVFTQQEPDSLLPEDGS
jgi:hypothetical protein